jgi:hypothetical protein
MSGSRESRPLKQAKPRPAGGVADAAPAIVSPPELLCYPTEPDPPRIVAARADRDWMDATDARFAYRCTPLAIANASGWELLLPFSFDATWMGGAERSAILIHSHDGDPRCARMVTSHFGNGVLTFHTGWLFRTPPGWAVWARGSPNSSKRNIAPLEGIVETDWLPFTFTMNGASRGWARRASRRANRSVSSRWRRMGCSTRCSRASASSKMIRRLIRRSSNGGRGARTSTNV